ncbi:hypothetical protein TNCV_2341411 [Trichonephila clavipes]|nr:hypothetical protein TNCV_2341411 [Trichonephila clavipes]
MSSNFNIQNTLFYFALYCDYGVVDYHSDVGNPTPGSKDLVRKSSLAQLSNGSRRYDVCLPTLVEHNATAFTPWEALIGECSPDVLHRSSQEHPIATLRLTAELEMDDHLSVY